MKRALAISFLLALTGFLPATSVLATDVNIVPISPNLPGSLNSASSPGGYVRNFYNYALFISGLLAFGAIVYGGVRYAWARGNPSGESDARQWIWSALLGILLLALAYVILYAVNPNLVDLRLPSLEQAKAPQNNYGSNITSQQGIVYCSGTTNGRCAITGQICQNDGTGHFSCQAISSFDCGKPPSHYGSCPGTENCVRTDSGQPNATLTFGCHT